MGVFTITELRQVGGVLMASQNPDGGEVFEWFADVRPPAGIAGGTRSAPLKPWDIGGKLRGEQTYYGGARTPSRQVLGPEWKPHTFRGSFDDRYNFPGYALDTKRRFESLCERGNLVRITFEQEAWEGYITDWDLTYQRSWDIPYRFEFTPNGRPQDRTLNDRSPATVPSISASFADLDTSVQALLDTHRSAPSNDLTGTRADDALTHLAGMAVQRDDISTSLDAGDFSGAPTNQLRQLATKMRAVHSFASDLIAQLSDARADNDLVTLSAIRMLDFEDWSRSLRYQARIAMGQARLSSNDLEERSDGRAERLYRTQAGENLYSVSTRFYGTPHAWGIIADRNDLSSYRVDGGTLLLIPERGQG